MHLNVSLNDLKSYWPYLCYVDKTKTHSLQDLKIQKKMFLELKALATSECCLNVVFFLNNLCLVFSHE